jgi:hypothetical protein
VAAMLAFSVTVVLAMVGILAAFFL